MAQPGKHLSVDSPDIVQGRVDVACTCDGENQPIRVRWSDPPAGTASFAVVVDDPDVSGARFVPWPVWDVNPRPPSPFAATGCHRGTQARRRHSPRPPASPAHKPMAVAPH